MALQYILFLEINSILTKEREHFDRKQFSMENDEKYAIFMNERDIQLKYY